MPTNGEDVDRLDRHDTYVGMLISVWFAGLGIYLLPIGAGALAAVDPETQRLLGACMLLGTTLGLSGSAMGPGQDLKITRPVRWFLRHFVKGYEPLAVRHCYRLAVAGLIATNVSLGYFSWVLLNNGTVVGSFTGLMTPILFVTWVRKIRKLWRKARSMDREFEAKKSAVMGEESAE